MILNWNVTKEDAELIYQIVERAARMAAFNRRDAIMDLTAAHANGTPLDLAGLLGADNANFAHDVFGIMNHLDRETGRLTEGGIFNPRYRRGQ